jgi:hypothetical protein
LEVLSLEVSAGAAEVWAAAVEPVVEIVVELPAAVPPLLGADVLEPCELSVEFPLAAGADEPPDAGGAAELPVAGARSFLKSLAELLGSVPDGAPPAGAPRPGNGCPAAGAFAPAPAGEIISAPAVSDPPAAGVPGGAVPLAAA